MEEGELKWARGEINSHKMFGGLQCECCSGGKVAAESTEVHVARTGTKQKSSSLPA